MMQSDLVPTITVNIPPSLTLTVTHEQLVELAIANRDLQLERTAAGELIVMAPTGSITGNRNLDIEGQLWLWNRQAKLGKTFNSSTGFHLPNGADRSPDAAWVRQDRWDALTPEQQEGFAPLCPDFIVELRSTHDNLSLLQVKMQEYMSNGTCLGWLIDRKNQTVEIYRQGQAVEILHRPLSLSGEDVLPGFVLDLTEVWN
ncbi:MAG: Uma2 family endonuclease [Pseudanabaena sp. RU_4_16]|nr:Uma2 family endonuclease [Pseudanabaena sp. RU_4_16]NKB16967.1 Uma2 family endonuclease [Pseudanabaena sp. CRU_2_10]